MPVGVGVSGGNMGRRQAEDAWGNSARAGVYTGGGQGVTKLPSKVLPCATGFRALQGPRRGETAGESAGKQPFG